ncbi:MAG: T9SS type A sorting domain-containing protein [Bacteroidota bacterium]
MRKLSPSRLAAPGALLCFFLFSFVSGFAERPSDPQGAQIVLSQHFGLNNKVYLSWELETGDPPKYWVVERAQMNGNFEAIGRVKVDKSRTFVDKAPWSSARYRIKAVWRDGNQKVSNYISWRMLSLYFPLEVAFEKEDESLMLRFPRTQSDLQFSIYDINGRTITQKAISPQQKEYQISTLALPEGQYILEAQYQGQNYRTRWLKY